VDLNNIAWRQSGTDVTGWNSVNLGGNTGGNAQEKWVAFDDLVVSTTDIADDYTPGGSSDTTPPIATINLPTTSATYTTTSSTINLGGNASDDKGVTLVTWANDRGDSGTASGTASWTVNGIILYSGTNVLTVTSHDAVGNTGTDVLTVTYNAPECSDGIDNDGDGQIDYPDDAGCTSLTDTDESNCGNEACESGETPTSCPADCESSCTSEADADGNSEVSIGELAQYISEWKQGIVTIGELINAISEWKNGC